MSDITVTINMGSFPTQIAQFRRMDGLRTGLQVAALHLQGILATYPAESHRPQPFVTDKQRKAFFAMLAAGEIEVPYRRGMSPGSQKLGQSWTTRLDGLTATVGTAVGYGPIVQGVPQHQYHRVTGWRNIKDVADSEGDTAKNIVMDYVRQDFG